LGIIALKGAAIMENKKELPKNPTEKALELNNPPSETDPFGSYTGKPIEKNEVPVQDQDDL
jgi:hypothetical protein